MAHSISKASLTPHFCETCGWDESFQRHRIKPGRFGGKYRIGNVIALCGNCHWRADNDVYLPKFLFSVVQQRLERELEQATITHEVFSHSVRYISECVAELEKDDKETF